MSNQKHRLIESLLNFFMFSILSYFELFSRNFILNWTDGKNSSSIQNIYSVRFITTWPSDIWQLHKRLQKKHS